MTHCIDIDRYCLPTDAEDAANTILSSIATGDLGQYMSDLATAWYVFLIMAAITTVLTIIYMVLLRWMAKPLLYISFVVIFLLLVGGGFYVFFSSYQYADYDHTSEVMKGMGVLIWILAGIYLILLCCCWS